jgi:putative endonuclease
VEKEMNVTYILRCGDGRLYTGWTNDIDKRFKDHQDGKGARFTKGRGPLSLEYVEILPTKSDAMKREAAIKKLSKIKKEELILNYKMSL